MKSYYDKLKTYNQIILALVGTSCLILAILACIFTLKELYPTRYVEEGMLINEEIDNLNEKEKRGEIISIANLEVIDSAQQLILLPVTHARLEEYEEESKSFGLMNSFSGSGYYYGGLVYNNLIINNLNEHSSVILFDERIGISEFSIQELNDEKFIIITGTSRDTNEDKILNGNDLQQLYIYTAYKELH